MTTENTEGTELKITIKASSWTKMVRERDEAREDARLLSERLTRLELDSAFALAKLERERDDARELADRYRAAFCSLKEYSAPMPFPWEGGTSPTANPPEKE